ncbi:acyltransferase domain-containing protein [Solirubrobacter ginsenosidimutans]|uniref:[acyl-carrier-protein] S-malonyltransferase n=1 Tax=Solirubrobacter ginsenosidimutans TaxID=490573 RepID=A0A9X3SB05_9ACTN|nr:acyltransferase domain-containing protein [Solirubrobacter ginsenosidimutans]MDA0166498.1 acyltransferase domain-containing protein [Solirubrobacter ginsenosidimutans]
MTGRRLRAIASGPAFLFPDHGSETAGRAAELLAREPRALHAVTAEPAAEPSAQPAHVAHCLALAGSAISHGLRPRFVAGHGLGGYTAATVAGVLRSEDALRLVTERGRLLAAAERQQSGRMAVIVGVPLDTVRYVCAVVRQRHGYVTLAQANAPQRAVVSGNASSVAVAVERARGCGAAAAMLPARVAHNSLLMASVQARLAQLAQTMHWHDARIPVMSGLQGGPLESGAAVRRALIGGETLPIQWTRSMTALLDEDCRHFLELGPGRALTVLSGEHDADAVAMAAGTHAGIAAFRGILSAAPQPERLAS